MLVKVRYISVKLAGSCASLLRIAFFCVQKPCSSSKITLPDCAPKHIDIFEAKAGLEDTISSKWNLHSLFLLYPLLLSLSLLKCAPTLFFVRKKYVYPHIPKPEPYRKLNFLNTRKLDHKILCYFNTSGHTQTLV